MATSFKSTGVSPSSTTRTLLYTCPNNVESAVVFGGTIANKDFTNQTVYYVTLEREFSPGQFRYIGARLAVPFGVSPQVPKIALTPGQSLYITTSTANVIDVDISIIERSV